MEEDEIEAWYEDEKQKLLDTYLDQLDKKVNKDQAEQDYTLKFDQLNQKYLQLVQKALAKKGKKTSLDKVREKLSIIIQKVRRQ